MIITKKHVSRRQLLRGTGVALSMPLLDAMIPAATAQSKTAAETPQRFFGGFVPHGAAPGYWVPERKEPSVTSCLSFGSRWSLLRII